ncbi:hypothetical protein EZS27_031047 [termite gut metagenome]|uniref:Uncharacterized protein n=1 Tax=termite gut metagenome TaxID=433724 RepID=A0A5J4QBW5_9ZZZZ
MLLRLNTGIITVEYWNYDGSIRAYASGIPELRRLHNSRMVYTKHPVWYIPYDSFAIYQTGICRWNVRCKLQGNGKWRAVFLVISC